MRYAGSFCSAQRKVKSLRPKAYVSVIPRVTRDHFKPHSLSSILKPQPFKIQKVLIISHIFSSNYRLAEPRLCVDREWKGAISASWESISGPIPKGREFCIWQRDREN